MTTDGYVKMNALIATDEVAARLSDPRVRLVEVDVDTTAYDSGHIAGAVGWNWKTDLQRRPTRDIPTKEEWEALLGRSGIAHDTRVVLYGDNHNWFAAFAYWLFKLYGHADVCLMNGGRKKWIDEGRELTGDSPRYPSVTYQARPMDTSLRALRDEVRGALVGSGMALVDVRSPGEYSGQLLAPENLPRKAPSAVGTSRGRGTFRGRRPLARTALSSRRWSCGGSTGTRASRPTSR